MSLPANPNTAPKLPQIGLFSRIKAKLSLGKKAAQSPDRVSELTKEVKTKLDNSRDLRFKQGELLEKQLQWRKDAPLRREVDKARTAAHRSRVRRPQKSALVRDVFAAEDSHGDALYMGLSNGQLIRADRPHKNPVIRRLISDRLSQDTKGAVDFRTDLTRAA